MLAATSLAVLQAPPKGGAPARDMSTDRPDATESPYTVPAGQWQVELSVFEHSRDDYNGVPVRQTSWLSANIKLGLRHNLDLQIVVAPYIRRTVRGIGPTSVDGFGDLQFRGKLNLVGNDGGNVAFGVMPFIKVPTAASDVGDGYVGGGLILPVAVSAFPLGFGVGMMVEVDVNREEGSRAYGLDFVHSLTVGHDLTGGWGAFLEYAGEAGLSRTRGYVGYLDAGVTFRPAPDLQFDGGARIGAVAPADDLVVFTGITVRR